MFGVAMYFLGIGIILLALKYLEMGPVAQWSWWLVLAPFALAVVWWAWADASGYTKKKAMEKMDKRKADRLAETRDRLGMGPKRK
jgi:small Trp-rich protein